MAYEFQVTVDCADPHAMADWWAETLGLAGAAAGRGIHPADDQRGARRRHRYEAAQTGRSSGSKGAGICHPEGTQARAPRVLFPAGSRGQGG